MKINCKRLLSLLAAIVLLLPCLGAAEEQEFRVRRGNPDSPKIAITVDDCAYESIVQELVALAKEYDIALTFFPIGYKLAAQSAELWQEIAASPKMESGCHTQKHSYWDFLKPAAISKEITDFLATIDEKLGYHYEVKQVHPPYGHANRTAGGGTTRTVKAILAELGFDHVVLWTVSNTNPKEALKQLKTVQFSYFMPPGRILSA